MSFIFGSFAQKTALDILNSKIKTTIQKELYKYKGDFGKTPMVDYVNVIDVTEKEGVYVVDGEFTYIHVVAGYETVLKTLKYQAKVKIILDDFSVIKVIYEKNGEWYRLFPANEF